MISDEDDEYSLIFLMKIMMKSEDDAHDDEKYWKNTRYLDPPAPYLENHHQNDAKNGENRWLCHTCVGVCEKCP